MFEKLEEEIEVKADEYALEESTACNYGESSKHVYQGYFYGFKKGAEFGYNKANEWHDLKTERPQLRKEVLWLIDNKLWLGELLESRIDFDEWELDSVLFNDYEIRWKEIVLPELKESE